jgi:hypothetical protein
VLNRLIYHVVLCEHYSGVWHPVAAGRHFDLDTEVAPSILGREHLILMHLQISELSKRLERLPQQSSPKLLQDSTSAR